MDLAGGLWRCQPDNCEKILAGALASRYCSFQFFASLEKWIGARNPVRIGSSCAAVTGYDFPLGQSLGRDLWGVSVGRQRISGDGEGGKKVRCRTGIIGQEPEYLSDPPHSAVAPICDRGRRDQRSRLQPKKLLRKKKNESWAMRLTGQTSPTL